eukprot:1159227-Pelagomonas_calceolata.AAC.12
MVGRMTCLTWPALCLRCPGIEEEPGEICQTKGKKILLELQANVFWVLTVTGIWGHKWHQWVSKDT